MSYQIILLPMVLSLFFCWFFSMFASKFKLIDQPNSRKLHSKPTPLVGGLAIFLTIYVFSINWLSPQMTTRFGTTLMTATHIR